MKNETNIKIPKKYEHMIREVYQDGDGYWCYTQDGYWSPLTECSTIHECSKRDLLEQIREIELAPDWYRT